MAVVMQRWCCGCSCQIFMASAVRYTVQSRAARKKGNILGEFSVNVRFITIILYGIVLARLQVKIQTCKIRGFGTRIKLGPISLAYQLKKTKKRHFYKSTLYQNYQNYTLMKSDAKGNVLTHL